MIFDSQPQRMGMFGQMTPGGYRFGEAVSALQKRIRAGDAREAAYWAVEIESCGAKERKYLWNRLKVIVSEDIGPTTEGNNLVVLVAALADNYHDAWTRRNDSYRLFLMHAIIAMCQASKTRICDDLAVLCLPAIRALRDPGQRPGQAHGPRQADGPGRPALAGRGNPGNSRQHGPGTLGR